MAKKNITLEELAGDLNFFDSPPKEEKESGANENLVSKKNDDLEKMERSNTNENLISKKNDDLEKGKKNEIVKPKKSSVFKKNDGIDFINEIIELRNSIIKDKSINQVHVNNISKLILDRLKFTYSHAISTLADAIIIDFYVKNKENIDKDYKSKMKSSDIF
jgi:transcriptional regulator NrdR family protein